MTPISISNAFVLLLILVLMSEGIAVFFTLVVAEPNNVFNGKHLVIAFTKTVLQLH
jgi:hypothetical protein